MVRTLLSSFIGTIGSNQVLKLTGGTLSLMIFKQLAHTSWKSRTILLIVVASENFYILV